MREYEACLIKCHINNQQWCYTKRGSISYTEDALVPVDALIYEVWALDELTLLAHSEPVERNGLMLLFVQKGTMELINPIETNRPIIEVLDKSCGDKRRDWMLGVAGLDGGLKPKQI